MPGSILVESWIFLVTLFLELGGFEGFCEVFGGRVSGKKLKI